MRFVGASYGRLERLWHIITKITLMFRLMPAAQRLKCDRGQKARRSDHIRSGKVSKMCSVGFMFSVGCQPCALEYG